MAERRGEMFLVVIVAIALGVGLAWDLLGSPVAAPATTPQEGTLFHEKALFCPPRPEGTKGFTSVTTWASNGEAADVSVGNSEATELSGDNARVEKVTKEGAFNVVGSGAPLLAGVTMNFTEPYAAVGAAQCSDTASGEWYFPEGSSDFRFDERILLYNPFPDEAVVRITFITPRGEESNSNLARVAVPSGESVDTAISTFTEHKPALAISVSAIRGRVVAWKAMFSNAEGRRPGVDLSLGATATSTRAFFPVGRADDASDERVTILNPSDEEALVSVSLMTKNGPIQEFVDKKVSRRSSRILDLGSLTGKKAPPLGPLSVHVESTNGVGIIAEEDVSLGSAGYEGVGSDLAIVEPSTAWWFGPAAVSPSQDGIVVLNLGAKPVTLNVTLLGTSGGPRTPDSLQGIKVRAGQRGAIDLSDFSSKGSFVVRLDADQPVVASRLAQGDGDIGLVAGTPIVEPDATPSAP
ncbi:MAG: hypothetical protein QOH90_975 [Actinomycetota bacterium]|nr:hypothetical protein [Actinomycetota bacterium]